MNLFQTKTKKKKGDAYDYNKKYKKKITSSFHCFCLIIFLLLQ